MAEDKPVILFDGICNYLLLLYCFDGWNAKAIMVHQVEIAYIIIPMAACCIGHNRDQFRVNRKFPLAGYINRRSWKDYRSHNKYPVPAFRLFPALSCIFNGKSPVIESYCKRAYLKPFRFYTH
ncbi:MAG TPA: hypothetical protein VIZ28_19435 [Chitinophagaceae bacterium]